MKPFLKSLARFILILLMVSNRELNIYKIYQNVHKLSPCSKIILLNRFQSIISFETSETKTREGETSETKTREGETSSGEETREGQETREEETSEWKRLSRFS